MVYLWHTPIYDLLATKVPTTVLTSSACFVWYNITVIKLLNNISFKWDKCNFQLRILKHHKRNASSLEADDRASTIAGMSPLSGSPRYPSHISTHAIIFAGLLIGPHCVVHHESGPHTCAVNHKCGGRERIYFPDTAQPI